MIFYLKKILTLKNGILFKNDIFTICIIFLNEFTYKNNYNLKKIEL